MPRTRRTSLLLAAAISVAAVGCAETPKQDELADALRTSGIPASEAKCAAEAVYSSLSDKEVEDFIERGASGIPKNDPAVTDDNADKLTEALAKCRDAEADRVGGGEEGSSTTSTTSTTAVPSTTSASLDTVPADDSAVTTTTTG